MPNSILALIAASGGSTGGGGGGGSFGTLLLLPLMVGVMYFVLIRPQRKRQKEMADLQSSIGVGDEVTTTSGIYGFITGVEDDVYWVEIDDDVQIRVAKAAIGARVAGTFDDALKDADSADRGAGGKSSGTKDSGSKSTGSKGSGSKSTGSKNTGSKESK